MPYNFDLRMQLLFPFDYFFRRYLSHDFHSYLLICVQHQRTHPFEAILDHFLYYTTDSRALTRGRSFVFEKMGKISFEPTESHNRRHEFNQDKRLTRASINNYVMFDRVNREQCKRLLANCVLLNQ